MNIKNIPKISYFVSRPIDFTINDYSKTYKISRYSVMKQNKFHSMDSSREVAFIKCEDTDLINEYIKFTLENEKETPQNTIKLINSFAKKLIMKDNYLSLFTQNNDTYKNIHLHKVFFDIFSELLSVIITTCLNKSCSIDTMSRIIISLKDIISDYDLKQKYDTHDGTSLEKFTVCLRKDIKNFNNNYEFDNSLTDKINTLVDKFQDIQYKKVKFSEIEEYRNMCVDDYKNFLTANLKNSDISLQIQEFQRTIDYIQCNSNLPNYMNSIVEVTSKLFDISNEYSVDQDLLLIIINNDFFEYLINNNKTENFTKILDNIPYYLQNEFYISVSKKNVELIRLFSHLKIISESMKKEELTNPQYVYLLQEPFGNILFENIDTYANKYSTITPPILHDFFINGCLEKYLYMSDNFIINIHDVYNYFFFTVEGVEKNKGPFRREKFEKAMNYFKNISIKTLICIRAFIAFSAIIRAVEYITDGLELYYKEKAIKMNILDEELKYMKSNKNFIQTKDYINKSFLNILNHNFD